MPLADVPSGIFLEGCARMLRTYIRQDAPHVRGLCLKCNKNPQKTRGGGKFRPLCSPCDERRHRGGKRRKRAPAYTRVKEGCCDLCGFVAVHKCQLDVDHVDGDHQNSAPKNLQTLCANCHRLKTHTQRWG